MKILKLSCGQFAGIRDFEVEFKDGINIVFGANESGKSSLVNILTETLLKNPSLNRGTIADRVFIESFFPCVTRASSETGNFIDGTVIFETQSGIFTLSKNWRNDGGRCSATLIQPNGDKIDNYDAVKKLLDTEFQRGDGILREILLSPQSVKMQSLNRLIQEPKALESHTEIIDILTRLYAETGSDVSINELEQKIIENINNLGRNWDKAKNKPKVERNHDAISDAYKKLEVLNNSLGSINTLKERLEILDGRFKKVNELAMNAKSRLESYNSVEIKLRTCISDRRRLEEKIKILENNRKRYAEALKKWPLIEEQLKQAKTFSDELKSANMQLTLQHIRELRSRIADIDRGLANMPPPDKIADDIKTAERANDIIMQCIGKLKGVDLTLKVHMLNNNNINILAASNGAAIMPSGYENGNNIYSINRAVIINIPDIAQIQLTSGGADIAAVKAEWDKNKIIVHDIIARYNLGDVHSIEVIRDKLTALRNDSERKQYERQRLESEINALQKRSIDELKNLNGKIDVNVNNDKSDNNNYEDNNYAAQRDVEAIRKDIKALGVEPERIDLFISKYSALHDIYLQDYTTLDNLKTLFNNSDTALTEARRELEAIEQQLNTVPDEFKSSDIAAMRDKLENDVKRYDDERDRAFADMQSCSHELQRKQIELGDSAKLESERQQAEIEFNNKKAELVRWENILKIFNKTKAEMKGNPVDVLIKRFSQYLDIISGGRLASENADAGAALKPKVYSKIYNNNYNNYNQERVLNWLNISEGTKETIALAFRLAVIDNLYQDGGAVTVFDDPLVNMDAERAKRACELIKKFADNNNQVIFLTCHKEYSESLNGHLIELN